MPSAIIPILCKRQLRFRQYSMILWFTGAVAVGRDGSLGLLSGTLWPFQSFFICTKKPTIDWRRTQLQGKNLCHLPKRSRFNKKGLLAFTVAESNILHDLLSRASCLEGTWFKSSICTFLVNSAAVATMYIEHRYNCHPVRASVWNLQYTAKELTLFLFSLHLH